MGVELYIPDCCEDTVVVPVKTYIGGQEGDGKYIWYRTSYKLSASDLMDMSNTHEGVTICGKTL